jgi:tetratricopeptide (TPR) repeat protein
VRKSADRVRIAVALVKAGDGANVWSETYDRELKDIFAVQSEIAGAVAKQLKVALLGSNGQAAPLTTAATDPDLAEGYAAKGNVLENLGRWTECKEAYRRSIELDPNFATAHQWYARNLSEEGYIDEAMVEMKRAVELDPLAPRILDNYAGYLIWLGKYPEALEILDQVLAIQPGSPQAHCFKGMALVKAGRAEEGLSMLETLARQPDQPEWTPVSLAEALLVTGRRREAEALLQHPPEDNFFRGLLLCVLGRDDEAVPLLKPAVSIYRDMILWTFQEVMPRQSPEFHRKLAEWGMTEAWDRAEARREKNLAKKAP